MIKEEKYFADAGHLDADSVDVKVPVNAWMNMENCRTGSTDAGVTEVVESVGSNRLLTSPQPSLTFYTIGSIDDTRNNRIFYFKYCTTNPNSHKISCYQFDDNTELDVLYSYQVDGGLNFDKDKLIHSIGLVDSLLFWTDDLNEPKRINVEKALKANNPSYDTEATAYELPMVYPTQTIIRRPPYYNLSVVKGIDGANTNNYINDKAFQFVYFYEYVDFEWSKLSAYSDLIPYGITDSDVYNFVTVAVRFDEQIDDDVQRIYMCVRYGNTGKTVVIKTYDKAIAADAAAIIAHNNNITQLGFDFYNNEAPSAIDDVQANTPYDSVPLRSESLETAKNRLFLGNNLMGYDTPTETSLSAEAVEVESGGGTFPGEWGYITLYANVTGDPTYANPFTYPFMYSLTAPSIFTYYPAVRQNANWNGAGYYVGDLPADVNYSDATITANDEATFVALLKMHVYPAASPLGFPIWDTTYLASYDYAGTHVMGDVIVYNASDTANFFKSGGTYNLSISFYDRFRRKCGVVNKKVQVIIPQRTYSQTSFTTAIRWALSNTDALDEIPDWAYFYMIHITKNLTTRFFLQGQADHASYAIKGITGEFTYTQTPDSQTQYGTAIDLTPLFNLGFGYTFTEHDLINLYQTGGTQPNIPVLAVDGYNVIFKWFDIGTIPTDGSLEIAYELFTPYLPVETEPYFETGPVYAVLNPGTSDRAYSVVSDTLIGDTYNIERTLDTNIFIAETMSPNDKVWRSWQTSTGWTNYITNLGQKWLPNQIRWSDTYLPDTQVNGLSTFQALSYKTTPHECGEISKLIVASKITEKGTVMLAIHRNETTSLYLGEVQVMASNANAFVATEDNVIGTINPLEGSYGCIDPSSVVYLRGKIYWVDRINGRVIQYASNPLFPISDYKMSRFWKLFCTQFSSMTAEEVEALGSRPFIFGGVDPRHNEVLFSVPRVLETPPQGYQIDYPDMIYPWDIYDGQAKTIVYNLSDDPNHWQGAYNIPAENFVSINNQLYSFYYGALYEHNQTDSYCNFYGVQYKARVMPVYNMGGEVNKTYANIKLFSNLTPTLTYFMSQVPYVQVSDIMDYEWATYEAFIYAYIKRNKIVPTESGYTLDGLTYAERMRTYALRVLLEFTVSTTPLQLRACILGFDLSRGQ